MATNRPAGPLDGSVYYPAFQAHDARFDGRAFVGVSSTGIYCRPVCRVRMPKKENCSFYGSAAAAEAAGYRPCMKCRPELAPGFAPVDAATRLSQKAVLLMEEEGLYESNLAALAQALGVTDRHLRRVFVSEYGVSPVQYLQTARLLLAKSLLSDSDLSVTEVAFAAGFGSVRRMNALFQQQYRMPPTALRKQAGPAEGPGRDSVTLYLGYRPPYRWESMLTFLETRAIPGVERVAEGIYHRTAAVWQGGKQHRGWIAVHNEEKRNAVAVTLSASLLPVLSQVLSRVKHLFDLECDPAEIYARLQGMNELREGICLPGTRLPGSFDPFEMAVRAVLGQQVSVKAVRTLAARVASTHGAGISTPIEGLTHTFPTPADICALDGPIENHLGTLGVIGARARSIQALASGLLAGEITLSRSADVAPQMKRLLALPGFGDWTVQYVAMRALGWPDAFPHTDYGVKAALQGRSPKEILALAEAWRPWRAYATLNLWHSL